MDLLRAGLLASTAVAVVLALGCGGGRSGPPLPACGPGPAVVLDFHPDQVSSSAYGCGPSAPPPATPCPAGSEVKAEQSSPTATATVDLPGFYPRQPMGYCLSGIEVGGSFVAGGSALTTREVLLEVDSFDMNTEVSSGIIDAAWFVSSSGQFSVTGGFPFSGIFLPVP